MELYIDTLKNRYAQFHGRANGKEYWTFFLFQCLIVVGPPFVYRALVDATTVRMISLESLWDGLSGLYLLFTFIPSLAVSVRRFHDVGMSGWFVLLHIICCIGTIVVLILHMIDSQQGTNKYGPNPLDKNSGAIDPTDINPRDDVPMLEFDLDDESLDEQEKERLRRIQERRKKERGE